MEIFFKKKKKKKFRNASNWNIQYNKEKNIENTHTHTHTSIHPYTYITKRIRKISTILNTATSLNTILWIIWDRKNDISRLFK